MPRERSRQLIGNVWKYVTAQQSDNGNGGSQPFKEVIVPWSFDDTDIDDPTTGVSVYTVAAGEIWFGFSIFVTTPFAGTDASDAALYVSEAGFTVAQNYQDAATNGIPIAIGFGSQMDTPTATGEITMAVADFNDNTSPVTVSGGAGYVKLLIWQDNT